MHEQLKALADLPEGMGSVPSTYMGVSQPFVTPLPGISNTLFWHQRILHAQSPHTYKAANPHMHEIKALIICMLFSAWLIMWTKEFLITLVCCAHRNLPCSWDWVCFPQNCSSLLGSIRNLPGILEVFGVVASRDSPYSNCFQSCINVETCIMEFSCSLSRAMCLNYVLPPL